MGEKKVSDLWKAASVYLGVLVGAGVLTWLLLESDASYRIGEPALGGVLLVGWAFTLALCYQGFSSLSLLYARRWMDDDHSSSSNYIDSKVLARTRLVTDVSFGFAAVIAMTVFALQLLGLPK